LQWLFSPCRIRTSSLSLPFLPSMLLMPPNISLNTDVVSFCSPTHALYPYLVVSAIFQEVFLSFFLKLFENWTTDACDLDVSLALFTFFSLEVDSPWDPVPSYSKSGGGAVRFAVPAFLNSPRRTEDFRVTIVDTRFRGWSLFFLIFGQWVSLFAELAPPPFARSLSRSGFLRHLLLSLSDCPLRNSVLPFPHDLSGHFTAFFAPPYGTESFLLVHTTEIPLHRCLVRFVCPH